MRDIYLSIKYKNTPQEKFYMLLNGIVTIIVARKKTVNISLNEYFRYISLLIIYKEQQILKQVVRESKNTNFIEIPGINYFFSKFLVLIIFLLFLMSKILLF